MGGGGGLAVVTELNHLMAEVIIRGSLFSILCMTGQAAMDRRKFHSGLKCGSIAFE